MGLPYTGSLMLKPYADRYGMDVYQVRRRMRLKWRCFIGVNLKFRLFWQLNFLLLELLALILGFVLQLVLKATIANTIKRHLFNVVAGISLGYFCYGSQLIHIFFQSYGCYLIMVFCPRKYSHMYYMRFLKSYFFFNFK